MTCYDGPHCQLVMYSFTLMESTKHVPVAIESFSKYNLSKAYYVLNRAWIWNQLKETTQEDFLFEGVWKIWKHLIQSGVFRHNLRSPINVNPEEQKQIVDKVCVLFAKLGVPTTTMAQ